MNRAFLSLVLFASLACGGAEESSANPAGDVPEAGRGGDAAPVPLSNEGDSGDSLRGDPANGAQLYAMYCATCHGQGGKGDGPAAPKDPPPADHTDPVRMGEMTDREMYDVIDKGGAAVGKSPLMASWGPILRAMGGGTDQGIKDVIAFIRQLSGT